jgi:hypothetical protein
MVKTLEKEFRFYVDHQDELVKEYNGKFVVIHGSAVAGTYESELEAIKEATKKYKPGTFLVQKCEPGNSSYTQTFHSRVAFV